MTKTEKVAVAVAVLAGLLSPDLSRAGDVEGLASGGAAGLSEALGAARGAVSASAAERGHRRKKSASDLKQEADQLDYWASQPRKPVSEKEECEGSFSDHVFVVSAKTGNKYCLSAFKQGPKEGDSRKTKWDIADEVASLDYWASQPQKPVGEKEACEGGFGDNVFVVSPKTGNKYCLSAFKQGPKEGDSRKTKFDIADEVALLDYYASQPQPPTPTPEQECRQGGNAWTVSGLGHGYCLDPYTQD
ncbi:MAG: hypothetical protein HY077_15270 [Elusimicrobia bacterium]|nr:hypothetical protein [Elusimicrobiota bacterium]